MKFKKIEKEKNQFKLIYEKTLNNEIIVYIDYNLNILRLTFGCDFMYIYWWFSEDSFVRMYIIEINSLQGSSLPASPLEAIKKPY